MDISSRQIVALGAPLVVGYLTWSALGGQVAALKQAAGAPTVATAAAAKRPVVGEPTRNPFLPLGSAAGVDNPGLEGEEGEGGPPDQTLHLDGTAISGTWRMALINGERVFEGQAYRGFRLSEVGTDSVTLTAPSGEMLKLSLDIARPSAPAAKDKQKGEAAVAKTQMAEALERGIDALKGKVEAELAAVGAAAPKM